MKTSDIKKLGEAWASVTSKEEELQEKMNPTDHVKEKDGKFCVYNADGSVAKEFDNKADADKYAIANHDKMMATKKEELEEAKTEEGNAFTKALQAAKDKGETSFVVAGKKYDVKTEEAKLAKEDASNDDEDDGEGIDKVDPKAAKKKFKDRKDKDIDNDGDVDSSDKFLHKRRKAIGKAMDGDDNKKKKVVGNDGEKKAEISKIGEATDELLNMIETAAKQQKSNATKPEEIMDKESPKSKEFANAHKKSDKKIEDNEEDGHDKTFKAGQATKAKSGKRPQDNSAGDTQVVKSTEAPVKEDVDMDAKEGSVSLVDMARDVLSGKTMSELRQELNKDDDKNPYDGRLKTAKGFLERMNKRRGYDKKDDC